ncbi:MAG: bifunctional hydroxymethylpyrimidine kinase/phosphomethylpyrimidine kinase [Huintestinicola sp.]|uniref:bifunctional hydroxymethylpyrimidine kinase/phosphomethylpyrimidine kinase n=1 Tax=Huintestinicola sp. TaxID=2981661 RepID=UPI003EFE8ADB
MKDIRKILSCAGSDSCGGAGIQADIKTISALGHFAMTAVTALTAQNTTEVSLAQAVSPEMMKAQLDMVFTDIFPDAVKVGMLMNGENAAIIADRLEFYKAEHIVCDTVIMSTGGRQLLDDDGIEVFINKLMPLAEVITPNIPEAQRLCKMKISTPTDMENAARALSGITKGGVLIKGGHLEGNALDILLYKGKFYYLESPRADNPNTHGTGCTLSSAIACGLAEGMSVPEAAEYAKKYITKVISAGLDLGRGNGPMWHFV